MWLGDVGMNKPTSIVDAEQFDFGADFTTEFYREVARHLTNVEARIKPSGAMRLPNAKGCTIAEGSALIAGVETNR